MNVNQQTMIVVFSQPRLNLRVEVTEKSTDVAVPFHFEVTLQAITMAVEVAAFVLKCFIGNLNVY